MSEPDVTNMPQLVEQKQHPTPNQNPKTQTKTAKKWKGEGKVPSSLSHIRVSYLYQAATYLQSATLKAAPVATSNDLQTPNIPQEKPYKHPAPALLALPNRLLHEARNVTFKQRLRISPAMKHSMCKKCDSLLIDSKSCTTEIENKSKGQRKPWADTLVRKCNTCGAARRTPMGERQKRRSLRLAISAGEVNDVKDGGNT